MHKRSVLITGCDSGLGKALAIHLDSKGVPVIAACLTEEGADQLVKDCSSRLETFVMDVTDDEKVLELRNKLESKLKNGLHALVNNAGIRCPNVAGDLECYKSKDFLKVLHVNSVAMANLSIQFLPLLEKAKGRIVFMGSISGRMASPYLIPYAMSKHATEGLTDSLRTTLLHRKSNVSVHLLEPGLYDTDLLSSRKLTQALIAGFDELPEDVKSQYKVKTHFTDKYLKVNENYKNVASKDLDEVAEAYENAIFSKYPRKRYSVGKDTYFVYLPLFYLPSFLSDYIIVRNTP